MYLLVHVMEAECHILKVVVKNHHVGDHHQKMTGINNRSKMSIAQHMQRISERHSVRIFHLVVRKWKKRVITTIHVNVNHLQIDFLSKHSLRWRSQEMITMVLEAQVHHQLVVQVVMVKTEEITVVLHLQVIAMLVLIRSLLQV